MLERSKYGPDDSREERLGRLDRHRNGADLLFPTRETVTRKSHVRNNIRKLRFSHDEMTQQELADRICVTRQTIVAIEKEKYSPSLEAAFRIAQVFDEPLESVFRFEPD